MNYADKIMNTEYYQKLKRVGNKIAKKYLAHPNEQCIAKAIPIRYLPIFKEFSLKVKPLRIRYRGNSTAQYIRPQSFCHKDRANSFAIYYK